MVCAFVISMMPVFSVELGPKNVETLFTNGRGLNVIERARILLIGVFDSSSINGRCVVCGDIIESGSGRGEISSISAVFARSMGWLWRGLRGGVLFSKSSSTRGSRGWMGSGSFREGGSCRSSVEELAAAAFCKLHSMFAEPRLELPPPLQWTSLGNSTEVGDMLKEKRLPAPGSWELGTSLLRAAGPGGVQVGFWDMPLLESLLLALSWWCQWGFNPLLDRAARARVLVRLSLSFALVEVGIFDGIRNVFVTCLIFFFPS